MPHCEKIVKIATRFLQKRVLTRKTIYDIMVKQTFLKGYIRYEKKICYINGIISRIDYVFWGV